MSAGARTLTSPRPITERYQTVFSYSYYTGATSSYLNHMTVGEQILKWFMLRKLMDLEEQCVVLITGALVQALLLVSMKVGFSLLISGLCCKS